MGVLPSFCSLIFCRPHLFGHQRNQILLVYNPKVMIARFFFITGAGVAPGRKQHFNFLSFQAEGIFKLLKIFNRIVDQKIVLITETLLYLPHIFHFA